MGALGGKAHQVERVPPRTAVGSRAAHGPGCRLRTPRATTLGGEDHVARAHEPDCTAYARPLVQGSTGRPGQLATPGAAHAHHGRQAFCRGLTRSPLMPPSTA